MITWTTDRDGIDWNTVDRIDVQACREIPARPLTNAPADLSYADVEVCLESQASFWTTYVHFVTGCYQAVDDFPTRARAEFYARGLRAGLAFFRGA